MMLHLRRISPIGRRNASLWDGVRAFSSTDQSSIKSSVSSALDLLSLKPGRTLIHNCGDGDEGKAVIQLAKERKLQTITIIEDKPGNPETIEELKALGGDIVVPESYTKTWYMKRLVNELTPAAGINLGEGYQVTAVGKAVADGGTFISLGKKLPTHVVYDGENRKSIRWDEFAKGKKLKIVNM
ncbi:trans-2-enoyl-CoA reductase, mitochondrial-like [Phalaenopsis equestris]|uniref:trans-2-enoyl-CoA reductase, mitochondrial-like n=1 Tax=Phalaenopsis equestris TaxID=78828 RepID=UPI0009E21A2B|nr:trans-2-enoyl-CoA reductase, mitochondrial-like [Phalaenopsis equestris]